MFHAGLDLVFQQGYDLGFSRGVILVAGFRGDCETGRNGNANQVHLCQVGAFAAQQVTHVGAAFCLAVSESVNSFSVCHSCKHFALSQKYGEVLRLPNVFPTFLLNVPANFAR